MEDRRFGHSDILISAAVIEEVSALLLHHAFYEHNIGRLADFLPLFFWLEDGVIGSPKELARILTVEDSNASAIDKLFVRAVVNENNSAWCEDGGRTRFGHP